MKLEGELRKKTDELNITKGEVENLREIMNGGLHKMASKVYEVRRRVNGKS